LPAHRQSTTLRKTEDTRRMTASPDALRQSPLYRVLHALARGETGSEALTGACLAAITRDSDGHAWSWVDAAGALAAARASDERRAEGRPLGRLDGVPIAVSDVFDVAGMPTGLGLPGHPGLAAEDAFVVQRLRGAGAVILGKTAVDEAGFGTVGRNPHHGDVRNPHAPDRVAGGSSGGAAAAVAAGHAIAALAADTLGGARIPAAFCGLVAHKPTFGELSCRGLAAGLRRLDCPALIVRAVQDAGLLLPVLHGYDAADPRSRKRRVPLAPPDWTPGRLKAGVVADLSTLGVDAAVVENFSAVMARVAPVFGSALPVALDIAPLDVDVSRRAAMLLMEAELLAVHGDRLGSASPRLRALLDYAVRKSAVDHAAAHRRLDDHIVMVRRLFEQYDVLLLPTVAGAPPPAGADEPHNLADLTALASLAGCPALHLPLPGGLGLQLVGEPRSDLRLLELGGILASVADTGE
jgi:Asp-tRNA(Asn)/Glu-tRNA(Gln) amidotransferase A subunit family amidase